MRMKLALSTMGAALLAALSSPGQATVLPYKNLQALVDESDGIVVATVRAVQAAATAPHDVDTFVTLDRIELLSGRLDAPTLTLKLRGGLVDGRGLHVDGVPSLKPDERVLLFVQGNGRDLVPLVGWSQGLFRLVTDPRSGQSYVQDADGNEVVGLADGQVERQAGAQLDVVLLGAPELQQARQPQPEAGGGQTEDGSPVTPLGVQAAPKRPMSAERFVAEMRRRAAGHAGRTLRSVAPGRVAAETAARPDAAPPSVRAAGQPVALPGADDVALPLPRPAADRPDAR